jgi:site-specific recombinase XerD
MKPTKFAHHLNKFFTVHLPSVGGRTPATVDSYRYAFIMLLAYMEERGVPANSLDICHLTRSNMLGFLGWLQTARGNSTATRNQRQAAINSFVKYLMYEFPDKIADCKMILGIPVKKAPQKEISYLKTDGVKLLFKQIDTSPTNGARDFAMLTLMYTTGLRVSELIGIKVKDVSLSKPPTLLVHGKGQKSRYLPLSCHAVHSLRLHIDRQRLDEDRRLCDWLFTNHMGRQFSRQGINYIVKKYFEMARLENPNIPIDRFSPHKMRHSTAMGLVESGVDLIYIRDLYGHVSVRTTEVYARADAARKREAIEAASKEIVPVEASLWDADDGLKGWLKRFNKDQAPLC